MDIKWDSVYAGLPYRVKRGRVSHPKPSIPQTQSKMHSDKNKRTSNKSFNKQETNPQTPERKLRQVR